MNTFDKFKDLYCGDFDSSATNFPSNLNALSYNVAREQNNKFEKEIYNLIEFIRLWKDRYELFCGKFNAYSYTTQNMQVWSMDKSERGYVPLPESELYIDEFFNRILNKGAKFEIQEYKNNYTLKNNKEFSYTQTPDKNIIISGNKFTIVGKDNNYRLDIKMNAALICSLIGVISNNHVMYQWYSKQSNFKKFVEKISNEFKYLSFEISNRKTTRIKLSSGIEDMLVDIDTGCGWCYLIYRNEVVKIENNLGYNHLDKLFGKDRKEPLTEEDLQLYSIVNEGRKPLMYDFEF